MRLVSTSRLAIGRITPMGRATGLVELTGAGFRAIGVGGTTTTFGSMDITGLADEVI